MVGVYGGPGMTCLQSKSYFVASGLWASLFNENSISQGHSKGASGKGEEKNEVTKAL